MNVGQIVTGHVSEMLGLNTDISKNRLDICKQCPLFLNQIGGICNPRLWLDPKTDDVSSIELNGYVKGCGCRLKAKTRLTNAICIANKW